MDLRGVTHDLELGGAVLADRTIVRGGPRHQLYLVPLVNVVLGEPPPTDQQTGLPAQTALVRRHGIYHWLWNAIFQQDL